ncbi:MAG: hypothetical protein CMP47_09820 [Rickettsiales bacterium]|jgi:hypothetical protein|nr:hypothetical protein [Rickettsiales bacterium]MBV35730.1 hypothetical protein [Rickettsiales bacterium]
MYKILLTMVILAVSFTLVAEEKGVPVQQGSQLSDKHVVISEVEKSCELNGLANCGCIAESMIPLITDAEASVISSRLKSGELSHENLIPRNRVKFNRAQQICNG